jgi:hypothetical protein
VLHTSNEYRTGAAAVIVPTIAGVDAFAEDNERRRRLAADRALDQVLTDSFPASDPPSWNTGIVRPSPKAGVEPHAERFDAIAGTAARAVASDVLDVSRTSSADRTFLKGLVSVAGATGIALLVPFAILAVGVPIVFATRGVLEAISWIVSVALQ